MSHMVQINYRQLANEAIGICDAAEQILSQIEDELNGMEKDASSLETEQTERLRKSILSEAADFSSRMEKIRVAAMQTGTHSLPSYSGFYSDALALKKEVNLLSSQKVTEYFSLLDALVVKNSEERDRKIRERNSGVVSIDASTQKVLDSISDVALRQFTYIAYLNDNSLTGDMLIEAGKEFMQECVEGTSAKRLEREKQKIRAELVAQKIDETQIESIVNVSGKSAQQDLEKMRSAATDEIVGEKVRQKSIQIITKAIQNRGFIVDKKNIKIKRDTNEVIIVAQKANNEKAEFRVFLDGKFIYDFHGYEGMACQKDIEPFIKDLEEVYGMHVTETKEIWKNPDKVQTKKYQMQQTKHDKG